MAASTLFVQTVPPKEGFVSVSFVTVSIFNTDNHVVNDCHTWTIIACFRKNDFLNGFKT